MTPKTLSIRKMAMGKRSEWGFRGLNPQPIDRAGQVVSAAWSNVVQATDGGTKAQVQEAVRLAEQAEEKFRQEWH